MKMLKEKRSLRVLFAVLIILSMFVALSLNLQAQEDEDETLEEYTELTGTLNYVFFGLAAAILPWNYVYKYAIKTIDNDSSIRPLLKSLNKLFRWAHYIIGLGAVGIISFHAYSTLSKWNIGLILGLALIWVYLFTGVLFYIKSIPGVYKKWVYRIHGSLILIIITALILYAGHLLAD